MINLLRGDPVNTVCTLILKEFNQQTYKTKLEVSDSTLDKIDKIFRLNGKSNIGTYDKLIDKIKINFPDRKVYFDLTKERFYHLDYLIIINTR